MEDSNLIRLIFDLSLIPVPGDGGEREGAVRESIAQLGEC